MWKGAPWRPVHKARTVHKARIMHRLSVDCQSTAVNYQLLNRSSRAYFSSNSSRISHTLALPPTLNSKSSLVILSQYL